MNQISCIWSLKVVIRCADLIERKRHVDVVSFVCRFSASLSWHSLANPLNNKSRLRSFVPNWKQTWIRDNLSMPSIDPVPPLEAIFTGSTREMLAAISDRAVHWKPAASLWARLGRGQMKPFTRRDHHTGIAFKEISRERLGIQVWKAR